MWGQDLVVFIETNSDESRYVSSENGPFKSKQENNESILGTLTQGPQIKRSQGQMQPRNGLEDKENRRKSH